MRLADRYRLDEEVGTGPVAAVWRGWDETLSRQVAVKIVGAARLDDALFCARFLEEARVAARLSHASIVAVTDFGEARVGGDRPVPFVVMEYLHGEDLAARLAKGPLPWREAVGIMTRVASALAHAHAAGTAHEGLKPSNVFLTAGGVKVLDFGMAKALGGPAKDAVSADINALGQLLVLALSGRPGGRLPANLPPSVAEICTRCLSQDPRVRPSAAEVAAKLTAARDEVHVAGDAPATPAAADPTVTTPDPAVTVPDPAVTSPDLGPPIAPDVIGEPGGRHARVRVPRQVKGTLVALGAITAILVLAFALSSGSSEDSAAPPQANVEATTEPATPEARPSSPPSSPDASQAASPVPTPSSSAEPTPRSPAPTATPTRAVPPPPAGGNPVQLLESAERSVREGMSAGEIRGDVGTDLVNAIGGLKRELQAGQPVDLAGRVGVLRDKINTRVRENGLTRGRADQLNGILAQIRG